MVPKSVRERIKAEKLAEDGRKKDEEDENFRQSSIEVKEHHSIMFGI